MTDAGTAPTQAISLTGVRGDLLQIAQAERIYIAQNGHCATFDELTSSNSLGMARARRETGTRIPLNAPVGTSASRLATLRLLPVRPFDIQRSRSINPWTSTR